MARRIPRFTPAQRMFHLLLMLSFLIQAATGLARMCIETGWGRTLAGVFGGYEACGNIHRWVGLFMMALFAAHLLYLLLAVPKNRLAGEDSLLPRGSDLSQMARHVAWMLGMGKEPGFGRFSYWEKFDYWAVFWGMVIIGTTGLMLYNPLATTRHFHGWSLNLALWVHRIEALLAIGHVFIIHFFVAHLRRRNFPMDPAMFVGTVDADHAAAERPEWAARMAMEKAVGETRPNPIVSVAGYVVGLGAVAVGLFLLIGGIMNLPLATW